MRKLHVLAGAVAGLCISSTSGFAAQTLSGAMQVTATVTSACTMATPTALSFGTSISTIPTTGVPEVTPGTFTVVCGGVGLPVSVTLGNGANAGAGTVRKVKSAAGATMDYALYSDATRASPWPATGTGFPIAATATAGTTGVAQKVYGKLLGGASVIIPATGAYTDAVTVTVSY
jgi:spore coat protein U-like protein